MFNLIKMDLRRLTRTKSFWIMIAVVVLMSAMSVYMTDVTRNLQQDYYAESGGFFVAVEAQSEWAGKIDFSKLISIDTTGMTLALLCAIFVPLFVNAEQKNGYIKNIAGQLPNRSALVLSKLVAVAVQVLVIFATYILSMAILGKIFWGADLGLESVGGFAKMVSLHYLLHVSFATVIMALTIFLRGSGLAMTYGILASSTMTSLVYVLVDTLLHKCGISDKFSVGNYAIENCIGIVSPDLAGKDLARVLVVGIAFLVAFAAAAMAVMQKRDVK